MANARIIHFSNSISSPIFSFSAGSYSASCFRQSQRAQWTDHLVLHRRFGIQRPQTLFPIEQRSRIRHRRTSYSCFVKPDKPPLLRANAAISRLLLTFPAHFLEHLPAVYSPDLNREHASNRGGSPGELIYVLSRPTAYRQTAVFHSVSCLLPVDGEITGLLSPRPIRRPRTSRESVSPTTRLSHTRESRQVVTAQLDFRTAKHLP